MAKVKPTTPQEAFQNYCRNPIIQKAMEMAGSSITADLLRDCFMAGAGYATERCQREHHQPIQSNH